MKFSFKKNDFLIKQIDNNFIYCYSFISKKYIILSNSFNMFLDGKTYDTKTLNLPADDLKQLENYIYNNEDLFVTNDSYKNKVTISQTFDTTYDNFWLNYLFDNPKPWGIIIETTTNCNLTCKHCYNSNHKEYLSLSTLNKLFSILNPNDNLSITFTGGELFCHPQIFSMIDLAVQNNKVVNFLTNGCLINEKLITKLLPYKKWIKSFQISLYAIDPIIHDTITGVLDSYKKTRNAIKLLLESGFNVQLSCLVMPENASQISKLINFARNLHVLINFCFKCISNCDNKELNASCDLDDEAFKLAYGDYLSCIKNFQLQKEDDHKGHVCTAGINKCVLGVNGELFLCPTWKREEFVNINNINTFEDFWNSEKLKNIRKLKKTSFDKCKTCQIREYCHPCLADNFNKNGNYLNENLEHCRLNLLKHQMEVSFLEKNR